MQTHLRVLSIGRDPRLMATRRRALATRYDVTILNDPAEITTLSPGAGFHIILLCHTLSARDCHNIIEEAGRRWPAARILSISNGFVSCDPRPPEVAIPGIAGPGALIERIDDLAGLAKAS